MRARTWWLWAIATAGACTLDTTGARIGGDREAGPGSGGSSLADGSGGAPDASTNDGSSGSSGTVDGGGTGGVPEAGCFPGSKACAGMCVQESDPAYGCVRTECSPCVIPNAAAECDLGRCTIGSCNPGWADCNGDSLDGCETNTDLDPTQCGGCVPPVGTGVNCFDNTAAASWVCAAGVCEVSTCPVGTGDCDGDDTNGCETNTNTSTDDCRFCGNVCNLAHANESCVAGNCEVASCQSPWDDCDGLAANGCETNTNTSLAHCGACGDDCDLARTATHQCQAGSCVPVTCDDGWGNCDTNPGNGCERNLNSSVGFCGSCTTPCAPAHATGACSGGNCGIGSCNSGWGNCDSNPGNGCETNTNTTTAHCGGCDSPCVNPNGSTTCSGGTCSPSCMAPWADCDGNPADGCQENLDSHPLHCGMCNRACPSGFACNTGQCACTQDSDCNAGSSGTCKAGGLCDCGPGPDCAEGERCLSGGGCG